MLTLLSLIHCISAQSKHPLRASSTPSCSVSVASTQNSGDCRMQMSASHAWLLILEVSVVSQTHCEWPSAQIMHWCWHHTINGSLQLSRKLSELQYLFSSNMLKASGMVCCESNCSSQVSFPNKFASAEIGHPSPTFCPWSYDSRLSMSEIISAGTSRSPNTLNRYAVLKSKASVLN